MDLFKLSLLGLALSIPVVLWDLFSRRPRGDAMAIWVQSAWMVLFICGFGLMDLFKLGLLWLALSIPVVLWDLFSRRPRGEGDAMAIWVQSAWMVLFICGFGLMLKITGFSEILLAASVLTGLVLLWNTIRIRYLKRNPAAFEPPWLEISRSFFPVILVVFLVRSFFYEPFKIPSGSMIPTLRVGDFILVNKYIWGLRLPVTNRVVVAVQQPERGDVMVFHYPVDPSTNFIKRVVGLPGDTIVYSHKSLTVNGQPVPLTVLGAFTDPEEGGGRFDHFDETLGHHGHEIISAPQQPSVFPDRVMSFPGRENCVYSLDGSGFTCTVPMGFYFMMGDNRDHSSDSRYWGFVPEQNIVGRAEWVWMNYQALGRIGTRVR
jgi:signal peptidase I